MIPWLIFRRTDSDAENWPEPALTEPVLTLFTRYPPSTALNVPTTLVCNFTKGEIGHALSIPWIASFASTFALSLQIEENKNTQTCGSFEVENQKSMVFASISYQQNEHSFREYIAALHWEENKQTYGSMASKESGNVLRIKSSFADWAFLW